VSEEYSEGRGDVTRTLGWRTDDNHAAMTPTAERPLAETTIERDEHASRIRGGHEDGAVVGADQVLVPHGVDVVTLASQMLREVPGKVLVELEPHEPVRGRIISSRARSAA